MYRVEFEFMLNDIEITDHKWHKDFLDNNGDGFTFEEAERLACELRYDEFFRTRNIDVVEMMQEVENDNITL